MGFTKRGKRPFLSMECLGSVGVRGKALWKCLIHAVVWGIWKERNLRIFEERCNCSNVVIYSIIREVGSWLFVTKEFDGLSLSDFVNDWVTVMSLRFPVHKVYVPNWIPPPPGFLKLNFDGSLRGNSGLCGFGYVIRDHQGDIIRVIVGPLGHGDSTKAEVLSLLHGLRELKRIGVSLGCVEGDSKVVIGWYSGLCDGVWKHSHFIQEVKEMVVSFKFSLVHVPRGQNSLAGKLATWGVGLDGLFSSSVMPVLPDDLD